MDNATTNAANDRAEQLVVSVNQKDRIIAILNDGKLFAEVRAGKLMRNFNHLLSFSPSANILYRDIAALMGQSRGRRNDETQVGIMVMERWLGKKKRAVQNDIRELTLSGALPLLEKREPGGLGGKRTVYAWVRDPFSLAEKQLLRAREAQPGDVNVATRAPIQIVDGDGTDRCPTDAQINWFADMDGEPEYGDPESGHYFWMRDHTDRCERCDK